jgi:hypothetical protein
VGYATPAPSDFKAQFQRDFSFSVPGFGGVAVATWVPGGAITGITITAPGFRYSDATQLVFTITDPAGTGATLHKDAQVTTGGITGAPTVQAGGNGYVQPVVTISGGGGDNTDMLKVTDTDIQNAIGDAVAFDPNQGFFATQADFTRAFLFLTAHYLQQSLLAATEGLSSQYNWLTTSKSVGDVSESYQIPEWAGRDPMLCDFGKTRYGARFLTIISPFLVGHMTALCRASNPV